VAFEGFALPFPTALGRLGSKTYGVYLLHPKIMEVVARLIYHLLPLVLAFEILFQPILIVSSLAIPLGVMAAVNRSRARRFYRWLFG